MCKILKWRATSQHISCSSAAKKELQDGKLFVLLLADSKARACTQQPPTAKKKKKKGSRVPRISVYWDPPRQGPNISIYHFHIKDKQSAFSRKQLSISVPRSVEQFPRSGFRFILSPSDLGEPLAKDSRQMV